MTSWGMMRISRLNRMMEQKMHALEAGNVELSRAYEELAVAEEAVEEAQRRLEKAKTEVRRLEAEAGAD